MVKKSLSILLVLSVGFIFTACSSSGKGSAEIVAAQKEVLKLSSGKIVVNASYENEFNSDTNITDFTFLLNKDNVYEYSQIQYDQSKKPLYCEINTSSMSEQWLLGAGWSKIETLKYDINNPPNMVSLITKEFEKKSISRIDKKTDGSNNVYTIEVDIDYLNKNIYKDSGMQVLSQNITYTVDENGLLVRYYDIADFLDKETGQKALYTVDASIIEQNTVTEITKPNYR